MNGWIMTRTPITRRRALGMIASGTAGVAVGTTGWVAGLGAQAGSGGRLPPAVDYSPSRWCWPAVTAYWTWN